MEAVGAVRQGGGGYYPTTIWSEVDRAGQMDNESSIAAIENLIGRYYRPLKVHLTLKFQVEPDVASEWLHEFVRRKVLLGNVLKAASRDRGRFRTFLLNVLDNFVVSDLRRANNQSHRPTNGIVSLEGVQPEEFTHSPSSPPDASTAEWVRAVLEQTLERMETECQAKGCAERWGIFKARLLDPLLDGGAEVGYDELIARFGYASPAEASNSLITAKRQFQRLLREVVAEYVGAGEDVEAELRELKRGITKG